MSIGEGYKRNNKKENGNRYCDHNNGMTIQGLYCYLDMGNNTVTYHKCSHVPNLLILIDLRFPVRCFLFIYHLQQKYFEPVFIDLHNHKSIITYTLSLFFFLEIPFTLLLMDL